MLPTTITRSCAITICQGQSTKWKQVTEFVITKGQANGTLPNYVHLGDTICLNFIGGLSSDWSN
jgi:non-ribosomal peptide synthetase component E (peptide arylation enzyme)